MTAALPPNKHQEKSLRTRVLLLDAAIDTLADIGYGHASISDIAGRAGVTRGAQVHHFHTRTELFAHTIDHLALRQRESMQRAADALPPVVSPADVVIDLVIATFAGTLGKATVELYGSLAGEDDLRRHVLRTQHDLTVELLELCRTLVGPGIASDRLDSTFWLSINMIRGLTADDMLGRDEQRRKQILADWRRLATAALSSDEPSQ